MSDISPLIKRSLVDQALDQLRQRINSGAWTGRRASADRTRAVCRAGHQPQHRARSHARAGVFRIDRDSPGRWQLLARRGRSARHARKRLSRCSLDQARETRHILEVEAIGLAALRRTDEDLVALREALGTSGSHYHGDLDTYIACDLVFHRRLVDAAHNPTLSELYRYFSSIVGAQLRQTLNIVPRRQEVFDLHIELLDAVEQRDPERAKALSRQLINEP